MPRHGQIPKREIPPDPVYDSVVLQRFINKVMMDGKKALAENIVYRALDKVAEKSKQDALEVFIKALNNITPLLDVKARRVGGATYQVPVEVSKLRGQALAIATNLRRISLE